MNPKTIIYAVAAFAAAGLLVTLTRRAGAAPALTGDGERLAGVDALYKQSSAQQGYSAAAIAAVHEDLRKSLSYDGAPSWWVGV